MENLFAQIFELGVRGEFICATWFPYNSFAQILVMRREFICADTWFLWRICLRKFAFISSSLCRWIYFAWILLRGNICLSRRPQDPTIHDTLSTNSQRRGSRSFLKNSNSSLIVTQRSQLFT